jgi:signal transduction histidine kinase
MLSEKNVPKHFKLLILPELKRLELTSSQILSLLGAILVPCSIVLDYFINSEYLSIFLVIRLIVSGVCFLIYFLSKQPRFKDIGSFFSVFALLTVGCGLLVMIHLLGYQDPYYAGLNLVYLATMVTIGGFTWTLIVCTLIYMGYLLPILIFQASSINIDAFINNNVFQLETITIAAVINHFQRKRRISEIFNRLTLERQSLEITTQEETKRQFIANITHDLKSPLSIISGHTEILRNSFTPNTVEIKYLYYIENSIFQINRLIDMLISTALLGDKNEKPRLELYNYPLFVKEFCDHFVLQGEHHNIKFRTEIPDEKVVIAIDNIWIERILGNLIQNSFKFTPKGGSVTVKLCINCNNMLTEIIDSGIGIPEEKIPFLFERNYQAHEEHKHLGQGLGLTITKEMVERLGGTIEIFSKISEGTTVRFSLPLYKDQLANIRNTATTYYEKRSGIDRRQQNRVKLIQDQIEKGASEENIIIDISLYENKAPQMPSILICEDNYGQLNLLIDGLKNEYNLVIALNGREGLNRLIEYGDKICLIISDVRMPEMDGLEFCRLVFSNDSFKRLPFIFLTAYANDSEQLKGLSYGATDYLQKPFNRSILIEKVNHWLSRRKHEQILENLVNTLEKKTQEICKLRSIIAHEIRNPLVVLNGIHFKLSKLKTIYFENADDKEKHLWKSVDHIYDEIISINGVLDSAKIIESGIANTILHAMPVSTILDKVIAETSHLTQSTEVRVVNQLGPDASVLCDCQLITQVFINLIRNAQEAIVEADTKQGLITITTSKEDNHVLIGISDNGTGIPESSLNSLFQYHYTTKKDGTGIGLYFSKRILNVHDGDIRVQSQTGKGTTFTIVLPWYVENKQ